MVFARKAEIFWYPPGIGVDVDGNISGNGGVSEVAGGGGGEFVDGVEVDDSPIFSCCARRTRIRLRRYSRT
jgi:hypothetical protein